MLLRENATMLFAFVCLSRQQIQPYHLVETLATPGDGAVGSRTPVRDNRLCTLLNILYSIIVLIVCQVKERYILSIPALYFFQDPK